MGFQIITRRVGEAEFVACLEQEFGCMLMPRQGAANSLHLPLTKLVSGEPVFCSQLPDCRRTARYPYATASLRKYPFCSSEHDKPVAFSCKVLPKRSNDENGIAAIQRRCRAG